MARKQASRPARKPAGTTAPAVKRAQPVRKPVSRTPTWFGPVAVVGGLALVVGAFFLIRWWTTPPPPPPLNADATQQVVTAITALPASEFEQIGAGSATNLIHAVSGSSLTGRAGRPEVFYYGAEYCPYCAAERWPLVIALSRFGTFSGLETTSSSSTDIYPNTPTFTFRHSSFTSQYIDFQSVETYDRNQNPLQAPTSEQDALFTKYDTSRYIPFVDFGNRYAFNGAMYLPNVLSSMSWQQVAQALQDPSSAQAKAIIGSANLLTAAICQLTQQQPTAVCSAPDIQSVEQKIH
jgi:thiol-disulfide isomerase/thioredoxin